MTLKEIILWPYHATLGAILAWLLRSITRHR